MNYFKSKAEAGFSLHKINYAMAGISLLVSFLFLLTAHEISQSYDTLLSATKKYNDLRDGAYELQEASDYLTGQARSFAMTGDRTYLDNYFTEATETQRREKALERLRIVEEQSEAYRDLQMAMEKSVDLMKTEYLSMRLTIIAHGYPLSDYPEAVRFVEIPEAYSAMTLAELQDIARSLVLNDSYRRQKDGISQDMKDCLSVLMREMTARQTEAEDELSALITRLQVMVVVLIVVVFLRILITSRLVIGPLLTGVLYIREGQQLPIQGAYEFRFLARTYNKMYQETKSQTEQLAYEAKHDKLTGVYNRSGYEYLMTKSDMDDSALLLVDVDKFKTINDTYGHKVGDRALIRVADSLKNSFGREDNEEYICRIGGDEFAVILMHTGPESKGWIERKVSQINTRLRKSSVGQPALSISVGCAFGGPQGSGAIDKDADVALYRVKENGRCGCAFYA